MPFLHVLAQAAPAPTGVPWGDILKIGVTPVVVVMMLLFRQLYIGPVVDRERENERALWQRALDAAVERAATAEKRAETSEERERRLRDAAEEKFIPTLNASEQTMQRVLDYLIGGKGGHE